MFFLLKTNLGGPEKYFVNTYNTSEIEVYKGYAVVSSMQDAECLRSTDNFNIVKEFITYDQALQHRDSLLVEKNESIVPAEVKGIIVTTPEIVRAKSLKTNTTSTTWWN